MFSIIYLCYVTCHTQWAWVTYGDSTKESTKEGLICSVREEPNSVQRCQFRFSTNHCQARAANPRKQPEKLGWESGVFSGVLRNAFRDPWNSPEKSPEKSSGPRSFRVFWETHARSLFGGDTTHGMGKAKWKRITYLIVISLSLGWGIEFPLYLKEYSVNSNQTCMRCNAFKLFTLYFHQCLRLFSKIDDRSRQNVVRTKTKKRHTNR